MGVCEICEDEQATVHCPDCDMNFCAGDDEVYHKPARLAGHKRSPIGGASASASPTAPAPAVPTTAIATAAPVTPIKSSPLPTPATSKEVTVCELCEENNASITCADCRQDLCNDCSEQLHKPANKAAHRRRPLGGVPSTPVSARNNKQHLTPLTASPATTTTTSTSSSAPIIATPTKVEPPSSSNASSSASTPQPRAQTPDSHHHNQNSTPNHPNTDSSSFPHQTPPPRRAMSASHSTGALRRPPSSGGRPRTAQPRSNTLASPPGLAGAPKALRQALSPERNVLSMTYGCHWEEPDTRPYVGPPGTFGYMSRDGSPKKNRNLLYSKSASDLLGGRPGSSGGGGDGTNPWDRLAKPKVFVSSVISPLFEDIKECTFQPRISPLSASIAPGKGAFHDRLEASVKLYRDKRYAPEGTGYTDPETTFKPKLNQNDKYIEKLGTGREGFVTRMYEDLDARKTKLKQIEEMVQFPFQPEVSASSKKRAARIKTPFLDRLKEDLDSREDGKLTRKAESERLPFSFQPNPERLSRNKYSFNVFLGRMENDLETRKEKYVERCKLFGLPPPEEVAAMVRNGKAPK